MGAGSPVTIMAYDSWKSAATMGSPMINIAKTILENHRYLIRRQGMTIFENVRVIHFHPGSVSEPTDVAVEGGRIAAGAAVWRQSTPEPTGMRPGAT
jgi:hypothetical protein